jgi:hypothetical protein
MLRPIFGCAIISNLPELTFPIDSSNAEDDSLIFQPSQRSYLQQLRAVVLASTAVPSVLTVFNKEDLHLVDALLAASRLSPAMSSLTAILVLLVTLKKIKTERLVNGTHCIALLAKLFAFGAWHFSFVSLFLRTVSNRVTV